MKYFQSYTCYYSLQVTFRRKEGTNFDYFNSSGTVSFGDENLKILLLCLCRERRKEGSGGFLGKWKLPEAPGYFPRKLGL